ncbi:3'-5' exoribonuclease csl4, putative [Toxoplasma gondii ME49]|uniref:3'-5' exoribonuclease csl4, putative n=3 Tax=Toxoplasma gondii TaxID=5811 RepID=S8F921_TOXGM|nr:3'-5' exoribonuclease csl4, putative [Toxoplasma gondii ME49]EPT30108.1 3'-5' exoribonuclease csl4, putative [Toxoplasma gondii ME49]KYF44285.1 putative 3'-5' exoribonuclease csl4 [Toxoplasma gondii ARI]PIL99616.1 putative 3'-5' exoribonuclease csl4 [Toxoplasma gondii COUG]|eukprot:XP_002367643.1 3'-5' exoribonuclease csl4, putative [Toxoplasma gondii ME49]
MEANVPSLQHSGMPLLPPGLQGRNSQQGSLLSARGSGTVAPENPTWEGTSAGRVQASPAKPVSSRSVRTPGERLSSTSEYACGRGTYVKDDFIYAAVVGIEQIDHPTPRGQPTTIEGRGGQKRAGGLPVLSVVPFAKSASVLPTTGCFVLAQVAKVARHRVECSILAVDGHTLAEPFRGFIRSQDIRETDVDSVDVLECFKPGDVVRAKVISMGDGRCYVLSTASAELGVLFAQGKEGGQLQPVTCTLMRCDITGRLQKRKVAAPVLLS